MNRHRSALQVVAFVLAGCGTDASDPATSPPPDTDWIVTHDLPPEGTGPVRAQRFQNGALRVVTVSAQAYGGLWSPDGRHYLYTQADAGTGTLLVRTVDEQGWSEPTVLSKGVPPSRLGAPLFSPSGDAFVLTHLTMTPATTESVVVYTARAAGGYEAHDLNVRSANDQAYTQWSPDGTVLTTHVASRIVLHLRAAGSFRAIELAPPAGHELAGSSGSDPRKGSFAVSPDHRFASVRTRSEEASPRDRVMAEYIYPLDGGAPYPIDGCTSNVADPAAVQCSVFGWIGSTPRLLLHRFTGGAQRVDRIDVYDAEARTTTPVQGDLSPLLWLNESRWVVAEQGKSTVLVDLTEVGAPRVLPLGARGSVGFSPDHRWAFLTSAQNRTVLDLSTPSPWAERAVPTWAGPAAHFTHGGHQAWSADVERPTITLQRLDLQTLAVARFDLPHGPVPSTWRWRFDGRFSADSTYLLVPRAGALAIWKVGTPLETASPLGDTPEWTTPAWRPSR